MMNAGDIAFPHLGIYLENVPRSFTVFGFEIAFYGLIIGIGVLAGIMMAVHQAKIRDRIRIPFGTSPFMP